MFESWVGWLTLEADLFSNLVGRRVPSDEWMLLLSFTEPLSPVGKVSF